MSSLTATYRSALESWAASLSLGLSGPVTVSATEPEPGTKPALPTLTALFSATDMGRFGREFKTVGADVHEVWGENVAQVSFRWRLSSKADAEAVHDNFRRMALMSAVSDATRTFESAAIPVRATIGGATYLASLGLTGSVIMAAPEDTQITNLWLVAHAAVFRFPEVYVSSTSPMAVSVDVNGVSAHLSSGSDPVQATPDF